MVGPTRPSPIRVAEEAKQINANLILLHQKINAQICSIQMGPTHDQHLTVDLMQYYIFFLLQFFFSSLSLLISFLCFISLLLSSLHSFADFALSRFRVLKVPAAFQLFCSLNFL